MLFLLGFTSCSKNINYSSNDLLKSVLFSNYKNSLDKDSLINNPFSFKILKNYSDNFASIGTIIDSSSSCPLKKENIADPSFCFIRTVNYNGLTIHIFSFDVLQSGTAEYIITKETFCLKNGIKIGSTEKELLKKLGKPYKIMDDGYIWRS